MLKNFLKYCLLFFCVLTFWTSVSAANVPVENVFSDITAEYKYRDELQLLYDRGMVYPDENGRFNPYALLDRDEFVGISMEVICKRCIQPHTEFEFIQKYAGKDVYYDINASNKYFYCVADADANNYVRWYDPGYQCEDGTQRDNERPFCSNNRITLEEAIAVILRNSGIFTIENNEAVRQKIVNGEVTQALSDDVFPKNSDGTPYTFYGYFEKALDFRLVEYDEFGNEKVYTMIDKIDNKLRPKKSITKEEFLRIAYVALKSNSCSEVTDNEIALAIDIWEKSCTEGDENCTLSNLNDPEDTYDFTPNAKGFCEEGIEDPTGYIWRFYNLSNGDEFFEYGDFLDNIVFPTAGEWRVYLTVRDRCWNTAQVYSTIIVEDTIDVEIDILDQSCTASDASCGFSGPVDPDEDAIYDFKPDVVTTCNAGIDNPAWYSRVFTNIDTGEQILREGDYIDNFEFLTDGTWRIYLIVKDKCWNAGDDDVYVNVWSKPEVFNPEEEEIALNVDIIAVPIIGNRNLLVDYDSIVYGGTPPFNYYWFFGDGGDGVGKTIDHLFLREGVYLTKLVVTDKNGLTGEATVLIKVLDGSCDIDSDNDGIADCNDACPTVPWVSENSGCPVVEIPCSPSGTCPTGYQCSQNSSQPFGVCLPDTPKEPNCLYNPSTSNIFGNAICNSCPCANYADFLADIRNCDIVFPAITSPDASDIYSRWNLWQIREK